MAHIDTIMDLDNDIRDLNDIQMLVDRIRSLHPSDGLVQLHMDRQQVWIDQHRTTLYDVMRAIAATN